MRIDCLKYEWVRGTEDITINFFSGVAPTLIETIDLYDYYVDETMSEIEYSFEDVDSDNTLYVKTSNLSFSCINDNLEGGTLLFDFFEVYESNKYLKWKLNYYDDNDSLIYSGIIYKDGVSVESVEDNILNIVCIGYEKEFKEYFAKDPLKAWDVEPVIQSFSSGVNGLTYLSLRDSILKNFTNVDFNFFSNFYHFINTYLCSEKPFTYQQNIATDPFYIKFKDDYNVLHLKTGYSSYVLDKVNKFTWFDSFIKPMGWIWYFYLNKLIIQERATTDYDVLDIDCSEAEVSQSLSHRYNQFQVNNVVIMDGSYFDLGYNRTAALSLFSVLSTNHGNLSHNLGGDSAIVYSDINFYSNKVRPFRALRINSDNHYGFTYYDHEFTRNIGLNEYTVDFINVSISHTSPYTITDTIINYNGFKTLILRPYVNSRDNSGGIDAHNRLADTGAYYGRGNFFLAANAPMTEHQGFYNGSAANSLFRYDADLELYINYEQHVRTEAFTKNFKKFLKTNDEVIIEIQVKQLITNPLQTIHLTNYQDANLEDKYFSIIRLSFHPIDEISTLTLQMIQ